MASPYDRRRGSSAARGNCWEKRGRSRASADGDMRPFSWPSRSWHWAFGFSSIKFLEVTAGGAAHLRQAQHPSATCFYLRHWSWAARVGSCVQQPPARRRSAQASRERPGPRWAVCVAARAAVARRRVFDQLARGGSRGNRVRRRRRRRGARSFTQPCRTWTTVRPSIPRPSIFASPRRCRRLPRAGRDQAPRAKAEFSSTRPPSATCRSSRPSRIPRPTGGGEPARCSPTRPVSAATTHGPTGGRDGGARARALGRRGLRWRAWPRARVRILQRRLRAARARRQQHSPAAPLTEYVQQEFLRPLEMTSTGYDLAHVPASHTRAAMGTTTACGRRSPRKAHVWAGRDERRGLRAVRRLGGAAWPPRDRRRRSRYLRRASRHERHTQTLPPPSTQRLARAARLLRARRPRSTPTRRILGEYFAHAGGLPGYGADVRCCPSAVSACSRARISPRLAAARDLRSRERARDERRLPEPLPSARAARWPEIAAKVADVYKERGRRARRGRRAGREPAARPRRSAAQRGDRRAQGATRPVPCGGLDPCRGNSTPPSSLLPASTGRSRRASRSRPPRLLPPSRSSSFARAERHASAGRAGSDRAPLARDRGGRIAPRRHRRMRIRRTRGASRTRRCSTVRRMRLGCCGASTIRTRSAARRTCARRRAAGHAFAAAPLV